MTKHALDLWGLLIEGLIHRLNKASTSTPSSLGIAINASVSDLRRVVAASALRARSFPGAFTFSSRSRMVFTLRVELFGITTSDISYKIISKISSCQSCLD
jgi:hypothetical protein